MRPALFLRTAAALPWPALLLTAVNLIPLAGVLFRDWSLFQIVVLYWLENVMIGVLNLLKMLLCSPALEGMPLPRSVRGVFHAAKVFFMPFFTVHYGMFCFVHGVFVFSLLSGESRGLMSGPLSGFPLMVERAAAAGGKWAVAALALSHLGSFGYHFLYKGEYRRTTLPQLMGAPYGRIVVLHLAILFGAFAIVALGSPVFLLVLLVTGKTLLDLALHLRAHRRQPESPPPVPGK